MPIKQKVLAGRKAVNSYRASHSQLYSMGWHKSIPEEHTPLLDIMVKALKKQDFNTIQEFFDASEELNMVELGFKSMADFEAKATNADWEDLKGMWE